MTLKNKSKILPLLLSIVLSATSCGKEEPIIDRDYLSDTREIIDNYDETKEKNDSTLAKFYRKFIENYGDYLSEEQFETFTYLMTSGFNKKGSTEQLTFNFLDEIMDINENKYGRGLLRAFNMRMVYENVFSSWMYRDEVYEHFNTLRSIVNNDEAFFGSLFSGDMDLFVKTVSEESYAPESLVEELILKMDAYSDVYESDEYNDVELKEVYQKQIKEIMSEIISKKLENDSEFRNTLYGRIISESDYTDKYRCSAINDLFDNGIHISFYNMTSSYSFYVPSKFLYRDLTIADIKRIAVCDIISKGDDEDNYFENIAMTLMIHLIDPNALSNKNLSSEEKRENMYNDLKDEFASIEDFDDFFLTVANGTSIIFYDYFNIFDRKILKEGITYDDFVRFTSLANYMNEKESVHIEWNQDFDYPPFDYIKTLPEEEYKKIVSSYSSSWIFDGMDYKTCMELSYNNIKDNSLGYEKLYGPNCRYSYEYGRVYVYDSSSSVVSEIIEPNIGVFDGVNVVYYKIPENYSSGRAVECFYNIQRKLTIVDIPGIVKQVKDPITGEDISIFIIDIANEIRDDLPEVRFAEYYEFYKENQENKTLTLEDN